jgi:hypothetical protein
MKVLNVAIYALCLSVSLAYSQTASKTDNDNSLQNAVLLSDVKTLALEIPKLDSPLARALANAEIADAAWTLDQNWARRLLKDLPYGRRTR